MQLPGALQSPTPEPLTVAWLRSGEEMARTLSSALSDRSAPIRVRGKHATYRLHGEVSGRAVVIRARRYVLGSPAGLESMALVVTGEVRDWGAGSQLEAVISAPRAPRWLDLAYAAFLIPLLIGGLNPGLSLIFWPFAAIWAAAIAFGGPHNQRALLKEAPEIARVLSTL